MKNKLFLIIIIVIVGVFVGQRFFRSDFDLPTGKDTTKETIVIKDGQVVDVIVPSPSDSNGKIMKKDSKETTTKEIFVTDGIRHSVPLNEILSGGPAKDGIPSIDNPKFLSVNDVDFLSDDDVGLGLCVNGDCRFYPFQILVWHEIVNDTIGGEPALITYCPLCFTGITFERKVGGKTVEFGTSGKLWKSNLVMYNRADDEKNESLWSQILGEAIVGEFTGTKLKIILSDVVKYGDWRTKLPITKVLSRDTGHLRVYGSDPYGDYYTSRRVSFGASFDDDRLHPKAYVVGIEVDGKFKAYHVDALKIGENEDVFAEQQITITKSPIDEVRIDIGPDNNTLPFIGGFWFSWLAVHPQTELLK